MAAGCACCAKLALLTAISLCIIFYGLSFDVTTIKPQMDVSRRFLPEDSYDPIARWVHELVANSPANPGLGMLIGDGIKLWSAAFGVRAWLGALDLGQGQVKHGVVLAFSASALLFTLVAILAFTIGSGILVALPCVTRCCCWPRWSW